mgnify:CR=1 FL=1
MIGIGSSAMKALLEREARLAEVVLSREPLVNEYESRLDRDSLTAERWFGGHGRTIASIEVQDAFVLDERAPHVLAIAGVRLDDGSARRYSFVLTGRPLRIATAGDGAWRALAIAMADGQMPEVRGLDSASHAR